MKKGGSRRDKQKWRNIVERGSEPNGRLQSDDATANLRSDRDNKSEESDGQHSGVCDRDRTAEHVAQRKQ